MSNVRIRYNKVENGVTISRRMFTTSEGAEVKAELNFNTMKYRILNSQTNEVVAESGDTVNKNVLKIQCKEGLLALGVNFGEENRNRTQGDSGREDANVN